ncbi:PadR family transcriptional regulator [Clostridium sp.]|uniref:PadR family transcriptional regulator n=1 Tax=Clostridium sp. TaxID=1506 RepID=UPI003F4C07FA
MRRNKKLPLTETVFYILLALKEPMHGYLIMQQVDDLSNGAVRMAAGTLYGAIENLLKLNYIKSVPNADKRRKVYERTTLGNEILIQDTERMKHMVDIANKQ